VPGVSFGVIQDGKLVWAGGIGVRELGKSEPVDDKTLFMIASNTKSLTTLMLAKLVEAKRIAWDQPVTSILFATFRNPRGRAVRTLERSWPGSWR